MAGTAWWRHTFQITDPLWGESTGHLWIPFTKSQWCGNLLPASIIFWTNSIMVGDLRPLNSHVKPQLSKMRDGWCKLLRNLSDTSAAGWLRRLASWRALGRFYMMTSSNGNIFCVTGHLCGEFTGPRWILHTKASDAELWCFLWSTAE